MSSNNQFLVTRSGRLFYGFDCDAEKWCSCTDYKHCDGTCTPTLSLEDALVVAKNAKECLKELTLESPLGYAEYGHTFERRLLKDNSPVLILEEEEAKKEARIKFKLSHTNSRGVIRTTEIKPSHIRTTSTNGAK